MIVLDQSAKGVGVRLSRDELTILVCALGEVLYALHPDELHPRLGYSRDEIETLRRDLDSILQKLGKC